MAERLHIVYDVFARVIRDRGILDDFAHRPVRGALLLIATLGLTAACEAPPKSDPQQQLTGNAMGTSFSIKIVAPRRDMELDAIRQEVDRVLSTVERQASTYVADSELSSFNSQRSADWFEVSPGLCGLVAEALTLSAATNGAFDVTVGPLVNLWGFGPTGPAGKPPDSELIAVLLQTTGHGALHADCSVPALRKDLPDLYVDLSAIAKGYGVDMLAATLDAAGVVNYLIEIGGEIRTRGVNANGDNWGIAIESPDNIGRTVHSVVPVSGGAVATSGDYRNFFEHEGRTYSHTIDPRTGYPITHDGASVTVIAETAAHADAMATALLVMGPAEGLAFADREGIAAVFLVRANGAFRSLRSRSFDERFGPE